MGRVLTPVKIQNLHSPSNYIEIQALVDTAAAYLTLPSSWKDRLGELRRFRTVVTQFADQRTGKAEVYGPVLLQIEGFQDISAEVLFIDMEANESGGYEPLLGYIPLEQANATVDMSGHFLVPLKYVDVKAYS